MKNSTGQLMVAEDASGARFDCGQTLGQWCKGSGGVMAG
jgi:hypothetical protein